MVTALVTGGNRGIGRAAVRQLAQRGFEVWLGARDADRGRQAEAELRAEGLAVTFLPLDIADDASVRAAAETVARQSESLDVLINNAAVSHDRQGDAYRAFPPSELPGANLRRTFDVNFFGAVAMTQAFLPLLRRSPAGRIVNVSSGLGAFALNRSDAFTQDLNILAYKTSKAALNMATLLFAHELRDTPIKVNAASPSAPIPGPIATDLSGPGRAEVLASQGFGSPDQGAQTLIHLATLPADGPSGIFYDINLGEHPW